MRRILSVLVALTLCAGLLPAFAMAEAPTTLTIGSNAYFPNSDWPDTAPWRKLQEDLNITIDFTLYDDDNFSLMLASGLLPDVVICCQKNLSSVISNKMALDVSPYLEEYLPNLLGDSYAASLNLIRESMGGEEKGVYFFAPCVGVESADGGTYSPRGFNARWDVYKQIGAPAVESWEDYVAVLKEMQAVMPETTDGRRTYAVGAYGTISNWSEIAAFIEPAMVNPWTYSGYMYMSGWSDRILYDGYTDPERSAYWTAMKFYNALYREDLLDPDSFTMTLDEYNEKVGAGIYMASASGNNILYNAQCKLDPDTLAGTVVIPSESTLVFSNKLALLGSAPTYIGFISASTENKEAAMRFYNYVYDPDFVRMSFSGEQGVEWDYDENGKPYLFDETLERMAVNDEAWQALGYGKTLWGLTGYIDTGTHPDGYPYALKTAKENRSLGISTLVKDYNEYYGVSYQTQALTNLVDAGKAIDLSNDCAQTIAAGISEIPLDIKRIMDKCNDVLYRALPKLVMAESDEAFAQIQQQVLEELAQAEESVAWDWCLNAFNASKAIVEPIFLEARTTAFGD